MKRSIMLVSAMLLFLAPAMPALARGDDWQPLPVNPYDWSCGSTTVHLTFPVNKEYFRDFPQQDGSVIEQFTGFLSVNFATDSGASITDNISGPGKNVFYPNGDFEYNAGGQNGFTLTPDQAASLGLPEIFVSSGPLDITIHPDGSIAPIRLPKVVRDICAELT